MSIWEKIKEHRFMVLLLVVFIIVGIWFALKRDQDYELLNHAFIQSDQEKNVVETSSAQIQHEIERAKIIVDVKGAVNSPGVYEIEYDARVYDVIQKAGGTTFDADLDAINLAAFMQDGQVVYVPKIGEENLEWSTQSGYQTHDHQSSLININRATARELEQLPGIGPSKATAIIQYREEHGPFSDVQQLLNVTGIGQKTLEKLLPYITVR